MLGRLMKISETNLKDLKAKEGIYYVVKGLFQAGRQPGFRKQMALSTEELLRFWLSCVLLLLAQLDLSLYRPSFML